MIRIECEQYRDGINKRLGQRRGLDWVGGKLCRIIIDGNVIYFVRPDGSMNVHDVSVGRWATTLPIATSPIDEIKTARSQWPGSSPRSLTATDCDTAQDVPCSLILIDVLITFLEPGNRVDCDQMRKSIKARVGADVSIRWVRDYLEPTIIAYRGDNGVVMTLEDYIVALT